MLKSYQNCSVPPARHKLCLGDNSTHFGESSFAWNQNISPEVQVQNGQRTHTKKTQLHKCERCAWACLCTCCTSRAVACVGERVFVAVHCNYLLSQGANDEYETCSTTQQWKLRKPERKRNEGWIAVCLSLNSTCTLGHHLKQCECICFLT